MKWFRFHSDVVHDPKVLRLPVKLRWRWVELLCLANQSEPRGYLPPIEDIALMLRVSEKDVSASLAAISAVGLIDITPEHVRPHNWEKWQPNSDNAAERMANKRRTSSEHVRPVIEHVRSREEENREEENRTDTEREQTLARSVTFVQHNNPPFPDEAGFAGEYARRYELRVGKHPGASQVSDALQLARDFGNEACVQAAEDTQWTKPPSWLRHKLEDRKNAAARPVADLSSSPFANIGQRFSAD